MVYNLEAFVAASRDVVRWLSSRSFGGSARTPSQMHGCQDLVSSYTVEAASDYSAYVGASSTILPKVHIPQTGCLVLNPWHRLSPKIITAVNVPFYLLLSSLGSISMGMKQRET